MNCCTVLRIFPLLLLSFLFSLISLFVLPYDINLLFTLLPSPWYYILLLGYLCQNVWVVFLTAALKGTYLEKKWDIMWPFNFVWLCIGLKMFQWAVQAMWQSQTQIRVELADFPSWSPPNFTSCFFSPFLFLYLRCGFIKGNITGKRGTPSLRYEKIYKYEAEKKALVLVSLWYLEVWHFMKVSASLSSGSHHHPWLTSCNPKMFNFLYLSDEKMVQSEPEIWLNITRWNNKRVVMLERNIFPFYI